ncbi:nucleic acid-binding protein [Methanobrevibacter sp.]|uniref:nucleic acid-binding protein n=1 Tax=Methanobrevibacter sp. TaxID=66852 RepID=UPI00388EC01A
MYTIYDIDCLLYFLKIKRADLLEAEFNHIVISNKVFNSLNNPSIPDFIKDNLNDLVDKGFVKVEEISYNTKTFDIYYEIKEDHKNQVLGDGEASSIAIAIKNNGIIAYNNPDAIKDYLEKYNLKCITVEDILKDLLKKGIISQAEFESLMK